MNRVLLAKMVHEIAKIIEAKKSKENPYNFKEIRNQILYSHSREIGEEMNIYKSEVSSQLGVRGGKIGGKKAGENKRKKELLKEARKKIAMQEAEKLEQEDDIRSGNINPPQE